MRQIEVFLNYNNRLKVKKSVRKWREFAKIAGVSRKLILSIEKILKGL